MTTIDLAKTFPFIDLLSRDSITAIQRQMKKHAFKRGEVIIHKGQEVGGVYLVQSGTLRIYSMDPNGNEKPIYNLNPGEICVFSLNCVLRQVVYPAWVRIDSSNAEVIALPTPTFRQLYENEPAARDYIMNALSQRIFDLMSLIEEVSIADLGSRINSYLVRACGTDNIVHLSHQDIATSVGTAREVVSRHLKQLEQSGHVQLSRMQIKILSPQKLASIPPRNAL